MMYKCGEVCWLTTSICPELIRDTPSFTKFTFLFSSFLILGEFGLFTLFVPVSLLVNFIYGPATRWFDRNCLTFGNRTLSVTEKYFV
jgi:hypothetical protein